jgi:Leucine-rich repeat (LRR) protein
MKGDTRLITPPPPPADPFVALFDGKDLTGWTKEKGEKSEKSIWKVEDGAMTCTGARSHLFFQDSFTDFHLRVEARINSGGNSGVFFRAQNNTPWPLGYEAQIALDKDAYRTGSLHGVVKLTEDLILPDTWFTMEVIAVGPRIRILLDGKEVVNYVDVTPKARSKGQIALQQNGAATRVLFRKIEIKPLKADASAAAPLDPGWLALVAKMAPEEQVEAVKAELMKRNPDFDGKIENQKIQGNVVTELAFAGTNVTDISPVRALTGLQKLKCDSPPTKKGRLADLSPLTGTKLTWLSVSNTQVADLTPLKDLKLTFLWIPGTKVTDLKALQDMKSTLTQLHFGHTSIDDLTPLKNMQLTNLDFVVTPVADLKPLTGMPLTFLSCDFTRVSDLSPLKGMQLTKIRCEKAKVTDLSWLKGMPLKEIACDFRAERDVEILRSITTLEKINGQDAKQLLK